MIEDNNLSTQTKKEFLRKQHETYLISLEKSKDLDSIGYYLTEHLRIGGAYWSLNALACLGVKVEG